MITMYNNETIGLRLPHDLLTALDERRGAVPRATYVRALIQLHLAPDEKEVVEASTRILRIVPAAQTADTVYETAPVDPTNPHSPMKAQEHRHKRVKGALVRHDRGTPVHTYTCATDGCDWTMDM